MSPPSASSAAALPLLVPLFSLMVPPSLGRSTAEELRCASCAVGKRRQLARRSKLLRELRHLLLQVGDFVGSGRATLEGNPRQVLAARGHGAPCLVFQLRDLRLDLLGLAFQLLLRRRDLDEALADFPQQLLLLRVRI